MAASKFGSLLHLAELYDVVLIQESHGAHPEFWELSRRLHSSHRLWFSLIPNASAGGLVFVIKLRFLALLINFRFKVISPGRAASLSLFFPLARSRSSTSTCCPRSRSPCVVRFFVGFVMHFQHFPSMLYS